MCSGCVLCWCNPCPGSILRPPTTSGCYQPTHLLTCLPALPPALLPGAVPERETCELILTDRGFDPVAPVIHEWTYEAMVFDLLSDTPALHDNVFVYDAQTQGGE